MTDLEQQIGKKLIEAMRAKDAIKLQTLRALKAVMKNAAIENGGADIPLDEGAITAIINKQIKQRQDSISQFSKAKREDLIEKEEAELAILREFLPPALSEEEILEFVKNAIAESGATGMADMGGVMKALQEKVAGRADGKLLAQAVRKQLS